MGHTVMGYRVDLDLLATKIGLKDKASRTKIRRSMMQSFSGYRFKTEGKEFATAVVNLLVGPPYKPHESPQLGYALEGLCDTFGASLLNSLLAPLDSSLLDDVDAHLKELGVEMVASLVRRGPPLSVPAADGAPSVGYLTPPELDALAAAFEGKDLRAATRPLSLRGDDHIPDASEMLRGWVREARKHRQSLVGFRY